VNRLSTILSQDSKGGNDSIAFTRGESTWIPVSVEGLRALEKRSGISKKKLL
jgi:hypothetical protein